MSLGCACPRFWATFTPCPRDPSGRAPCLIIWWISDHKRRQARSFICRWKQRKDRKSKHCSAIVGSYISKSFLDEVPLIYVVRISKGIDQSTLSNNLVNFWLVSADKPEVLFGDGNRERERSQNSGPDLGIAVGIRNPQWFGIRNPLWYGIRNPEGWNPESKGLKSRIQMLGSGIQDLRGFSYIFLGRNSDHKKHIICKLLHILLPHSFSKFGRISLLIT